MPYHSGRIHVLVLGPARSGTTLLASMIGYHPEARMMSECTSHEHRQQIGGRVVGNKLCVPNHITLEDEGPLIKRPVSPESKLARTAGLLRRILGYQRPSPKSIRTYVDKWDARLVLIVRQPDHVVHSIQKRGGKTAEIARYRWAEAIMTIYTLLDQYPQRTHFLQFEDLVADPEDVMRGVCHFIGLDFDPVVLEGYRGTPQYERNKIDESIAHKPVPASNISRYYPMAFEMYRELTRAVEHRSEKGPARKGKHHGR